MPFGNLWLMQSVDEVLVTPPGPMNTKNDRFGKTFDDVAGLEGWNNWMRWDSVEPVISTASSLSSPDTWTIGLETLDNDTMSASYLHDGEFPFADAPIELDDTTLPFITSIKNLKAPTSPSTTIYSAQTLQHNLRGLYRRVSSLTAAEEKALQDIAMPPALSDLILAPTATFLMECQSLVSPVALPEPEVRRRTNKKRKSVDLEEPQHVISCQSRKRGHNAIEKRYRTNLNEKIECLREGVPSLINIDTNADEKRFDGEHNEPANQQKYGKACILARALAYIQYLEGTTQRLGGEVDTLKTRVGAFEILATNGGNTSNGNRIDGMSRPVLTKSVTLKSVQSDFQLMKRKSKGTSGTNTQTRGSSRRQKDKKRATARGR